MKPNVEWTSGNRVHLLENGDAYFPAVLAAIDAAEREVLIETFILFEDRVGRDLQQHLINATARGVEVDLTAIRTAREPVLIANAYFFPGYRLLRDLRRAASRGVTVQLILPNDPDVRIARVAARLLGSFAYHVAHGFPRWLRVLPYSSSRIRSFVHGQRIDTTIAFDASVNGD